MLRIVFFTSVLLVLFSVASFLPTPISQDACPLLSNSFRVKVFLTISSMYSSTTDDGIVQRQLEINWIGEDYTQGDLIAVYQQDPIKYKDSIAVFEFDPQDYPGGYLRSNLQIPVQFFDISIIHHDNHCLGYWVAYKNIKNDIEASSCLQIRPQWMQKIGEHISHLKLNQLMIPGSHDSGSFFFHRETEPLSKYKYAQEESILSQLIYGLRYFDLRVGYYPKTEEKYFINHNFLRTKHSIKSVLQQVHQFLKATKEIVILDFHNFPIGFNSDDVHINLMTQIIKAFHRYLIPCNPKYEAANLGQLWKQGKRLLISYDSPTRAGEFAKYLWPSIPRAWGNKQRPEDLKSYFQKVFEKPVPAGIWASMAELTPNTKTIVLHPETGLRYYADLINKNVTHWFRDFYWQKANIVATDFFLGNDMIDVAVKANVAKGTCPEKIWTKLKL